VKIVDKKIRLECFFLGGGGGWGGGGGGGNSHIKGTGVLVVPRRVFSLKRSTAEVLEEPFRILSRKNMTGDTVFF